MRLEAGARQLLVRGRIAHLATATSSGRPQVVPICYAYDGVSIYSSIDEKPKRVTPNRLRRVLNIRMNSQVSLVVDHYRENWHELRYVIIQGSAEILRSGAEHRKGVLLLRNKYHQYRSMNLEGRPVIKITPIHASIWRSGKV